MSYIITKELHEDGTLHMHIYLEFKKQMCVGSRGKLHVKLTNNDGEETIQEGKYEATRDSKVKNLKCRKKCWNDKQICPTRRLWSCLALAELVKLNFLNQC